MISNIDLLRDTSPEEDEAPTRPSSRSSLSRASSENDAMSGVLDRLMSHIENTDRRHTDALSALNDRLDKLADQVFTSPQSEPTLDVEATTELQGHMSDISDKLATAQQAQSGKSARAVFEEKLSALSAKLEKADKANKNGAPAAEETDPDLLLPSQAEEERSQQAEEISHEDTHSSADRSDSRVPNQQAAPPIDDAELDDLIMVPAPSQTAELSQPFEDEIAAAALTQDSFAMNDPVISRRASEQSPSVDATQNELQASFISEADSLTTDIDAIEAITSGFEDEQVPEEEDFSAAISSELPVTKAPTTPAQSGAASATYLDATASNVEPRIDGLVARFEDIMREQNTEPLIRTIEAQIAELPAYFDREENRAQRLEMIETNISQLTSMISETRAAISELSEKIAEETATHVVNKMDWGTSADKLAAIDNYLANFKQAERQQEEEANETIEAVYGALEKMVDRLEAMDSEKENIVAQVTAAAQIKHAPQFQEAVAATPEPEKKTVSEDTTKPLIARLAEQEANKDKIQSAPTQTKFAPPSSFAEPEQERFGKRNLIKDEPEQQAIHRPDFLDDDDYEEEKFGSHADSHVDAADEDWRQTVPPYIAAKQLRQQSHNANWASRNKTALVAAVMVVLCAGGGLLFTQLSDFSGGTPTNGYPDIASRSNSGYGAEQNNPAQTTGAIPNQSAGQNSQANNNLERFNPGNQYNNAPAPYQNTVQNNVPAPTPAQPQAPQPKTSEQLPGVTIGNVSDRGMRHQLQQSVKHQQLAERAGRNMQEVAPDLLTPPATASAPTAGSAQPFQTGALPAANSYQPSTQPAQQLNQTLPPPSIGPMSLRVAAANGDPKSEYEVGSRYARGSGVNQDLPEAVRWFNKAASTGYAPAQYRLATHYERGAGIPKNLDTAKVWYLRAAQGGNVKAMHNYAVLHTGREGVKPNFALAAEWFQKAANFGLSDSQYNLAVLYENGLGVGRDLIKSYKWLTLASLNGDREAGKRREVLRQQIPASAIAAAEKAALEWKPSIPAQNANAEKVGSLTPSNNTRPTSVATAPPQPVRNSAPTRVPVPTSARTPSVATTSPAPQQATQPQLTSAQPTVVAAATPQEVQGPPSPLVKKAQELLSKLGYDTGPADGQAGPKTREAIAAFQRRAGMNETGDVSPALIQRLASLSL